MSNATPDRGSIDSVLSEFLDPETGRSVLSTEQVLDIELDGSHLTLTLELTTHGAPLWQETRVALERLLRERLDGLTAVDVNLAVHHRPPEPVGDIGLTAKSIVAVGSGKGGVGKSTIAASIACGLQQAGCQVGLMDADVYGPSIPHLLGVEGRPAVVDQRIEPITADGIKIISMGLLVPPGEAVVWRGPMLHGAITQFLRDTNWGELDYLIIDMPPGTGDIALTLSQLLPLTGVVVVCTPQDVALLDAVKAIAMFDKVNIPILGIVENMSHFECPKCGDRHEIFGSGGAKKKAEELGVRFLGEVPINMQIRIHGDAGQTGANLQDMSSADCLQTLCRQLVSNIADQRKSEPKLPSLDVLGS